MRQDEHSRRASRILAATSPGFRFLLRANEVIK
jgi:hypothetical protein